MKNEIIRMALSTLILMTCIVSSLSSQSISNGIKVNKYGPMHSHSLRYNINTSYYTDKNVIQVGIEYSNFIDNANPNIEQFTPSIGIYLNNEMSFELEGNYIINENKNRNGLYFNIGFRLDTNYNVSYDIKIGESCLQLGVMYNVNFISLIKKHKRRHNK